MAFAATNQPMTYEEYLARLQRGDVLSSGQPVPQIYSEGGAVAPVGGQQQVNYQQELGRGQGQGQPSPPPGENPGFFGRLKQDLTKPIGEDGTPAWKYGAAQAIENVGQGVSSRISGQPYRPSSTWIDLMQQRMSDEGRGKRADKTFTKRLGETQASTLELERKKKLEGLGGYKPGKPSATKEQLEILKAGGKDAELLQKLFEMKASASSDPALKKTQQMLDVLMKTWMLENKKVTAKRDEGKDVRASEKQTADIAGKAEIIKEKFLDKYRNKEGKLINVPNQQALDNINKVLSKHGFKLTFPSETFAQKAKRKGLGQIGFDASVQPTLEETSANKPPSKQGGDVKPPAVGNQGKTIVDNKTGKYERSNGKVWVEIEAPQGK